MCPNRVHYLPDRAVTLYRREAKLRSRRGPITHCQALDEVAREHAFPHWRGVAAARSRSAAAEQVFRKGFVIAMDIKEAMDFDCSAGFVDDPLVTHLAIDRLVTERIAERRASPSPAVYYHDPDLGNAWEESDFDFQQEYEDLGLNMAILCYAGSIPISSPGVATHLLCDLCFWRPELIWFEGKIYDGQWINDQVYGPPPPLLDDEIVVLRWNP